MENDHIVEQSRCPTVQSPIISNLANSETPQSTFRAMDSEEHDLDPSSSHLASIDSLRSSREAHIFSRLLKGETVKIIVGKDKVVFTINKGLLCDLSLFFEKAFNGPFEEAAKSEMVLPEDTEEVFSEFVTWAYTKGLIPHEDRALTQNLYNSDISLLIELYAFSSKILCYKLNNSIVETIRDKCNAGNNDVLTLEHIKQVFQSTPDYPNNKLRLFCIASIAYKLHEHKEPESEEDEQDEDYPIQLNNLIQEVPEISLKLLQYQWKTSKCSFHTVRDGHRYPNPATTRWRGLHHFFDRCFFHEHSEVNSCGPPSPLEPEDPRLFDSHLEDEDAEFWYNDR